MNVVRGWHAHCFTYYNGLPGHGTDTKGSERRAAPETQTRRHHAQLVRRKLTRTFNALPAELMLIPNLGNPEYVTAVLDGCLEHLPRKFAGANLDGHSYASWRERNTSLNLGRIPTRILRQPDFVEHVIEIYDDQCRGKNKAA